MTKKGPLSKAEKFYIKNNTDLSIDVLCKDLDRAKSTVQKYCKTLPPEEESSPAKIANKDTPTMSQFGRNGKGSVVMTENASVMGDEQRGRAISPERTRKCTIKARENDG